MDGGNNSSKRNHLQIKDIETIITIYKKTNIYPMSWFSAHIWEHIKNNYLQHSNLIDTVYRNALLESMVCFMYVLNYIIIQCGKKGKIILKQCFLEKHFKEFSFDYHFDSDGTILNTLPRHQTDRASKELNRYVDIAFEAVKNFNNKENRRITSDLPKKMQTELNSLVHQINSNNNSIDEIKKEIESIVEHMEYMIIDKIKEEY